MHFISIKSTQTQISFSSLSRARLYEQHTIRNLKSSLSPTIHLVTITRFIIYISSESLLFPSIMKV